MRQRVVLCSISIVFLIQFGVFSTSPTPAASSGASPASVSPEADQKEREIQAIRAEVNQFVQKQQIEQAKFREQLKASKEGEMEKLMKDLDQRISMLNKRIEYFQKQKSKVEKIK